MSSRTCQSGLFRWDRNDEVLLFSYCCDLLMKISFGFKYICNISLEDPSPELQACDSAPCLNNGSCIEVSDVNFVCACRDGFYGITCEQSEFFSVGGKLFC